MRLGAGRRAIPGKPGRLTPSEPFPPEPTLTYREITEEGDTVGANTKAVTDASFLEDVLQADKPVLVDFWAEWCGPCRMVAPILEEIAAENPDKITVVKLNVDENPQTASSYGVVSIPTLNVYQGGQVVKQIVGAKPKKALLKDLAEFL